MKDCFMGQASRMKGKRSRFECKDWPVDVIRAMETHLKLLRNTRNDHEEEDDCISHCSDIVIDRAAIAGNNLEDVRLVELNNHQSPLPKNWEQFLDLQTGRMFFVDWSTCKKSRFDPRKLTQLANHKVSSLFQQARARWGLQSGVPPADSSLCVSEVISKTESLDEMEVQSRYSPVLHDQVVDGCVVKEVCSPTQINDHRPEFTSETSLHSLPFQCMHCFDDFPS